MNSRLILNELCVGKTHDDSVESPAHLKRETPFRIMPTAPAEELRSVVIAGSMSIG